jgi:hypothetical protein
MDVAPRSGDESADQLKRLTFTVVNLVNSSLTEGKNLRPGYANKIGECVAMMNWIEAQSWTKDLRQEPRRRCWP